MKIGLLFIKYCNLIFKHGFTFLSLEITVFFFSIPCKRIENIRKSLEAKPFESFRAKV